ncbi:MAG: S24 family peptidase [Deltaproteobacteria bacterium]|jgi:hypothetical protein|nr:S24 family peptidase [Deltaproteobacteria bacterium]
MKKHDKLFTSALNYFYQKDGSLFSFAQRVGVSSGYLGDLLNERRSGTDKTKRQIAANLGYKDHDYALFLDIGRDILCGLNPQDSIQPYVDNLKVTKKVFYIINFTNKLSLDDNNRIIVDKDQNLSPVMFHSSQFSKKNLDNLFAFKLVGHQMDPLICNKSILIVDQLQKTIHNSDIYLTVNLQNRSKFIVSFLSIDNDRNIYIIDLYNRKYKPYIVSTSNLFIIGKVINIITPFR